MGEKIFDSLASLATGKYSKIFWAITISLLIIILVVYPYIDANFMYYNRIEKRIDNLTKLVEITGKPIEESPELSFEYNNIIEEIKAAQEKNISKAINSKNNSSFEYWVKFISGGFLFAILSLVCLFQKNKQGKMTFSYFIKNNLLVFIFCLGICLLLAFIFSKIPIIFSVWINAILAPIIQFIVADLLLVKTSNSQK